MKKRKILAGVMAASIVAASTSVVMMFEVNAYSANISSVPSEVVSAYVMYSDSEWNAVNSDAAVSVSNGSAVVDNLSAGGYYTVIFCSDEAEIGTASFFLGDSGKIYSYEYDYNSSNNEYKPTYTEVTAVSYVPNEYCKLLDISGDKSVVIEEVPAEIRSEQIYVSKDETYYGEARDEVSPDTDGRITLSNLGVVGDYSADFYDGDGDVIGYVNFYLDEEGKTYIHDSEYNSSTDEWEDIYVEADTLYFIEYAGDEIGYFEEEAPVYSAVISNVPDSVSIAEVQYLDDNMNSLEICTEVNIAGGSVEVSNMQPGYYTLNFYDAYNEVIGYSTFYINDDGAFYTYDRSEQIDAPAYNSFESKVEYKSGDMLVNIYDVPEEIDSVEARYLYGKEEDEAVWFEPEISSTYVEPLTVSGFGTAGNYKLYFYENGEISGYAEFYLDADGKTYYNDSVYNSNTKQWENTLVETDSIYFYVNNDIESADDYSYGSTKLTITNVPTDVKYAEIIDYENDSTFTAGLPIFPDVNINGKGTVTVNNFGEAGYYEIDLIKADAETKAGYVFIYIDDSMNVYLLEYYINPDTFQIETVKTQTNAISLTPYLSSTIEYVKGKSSVSVNKVPLTANRILVTCTASDGSYASFEREISVNENGIAKITGLGLEGDYTVSFMNGRNYLGSASFYLKPDGSVCEAVYTYNPDGTISTSLSGLSKVVFEPSENSVNYANGDLDFSGSINVSDLVIMNRYLLGAGGINSSQYYIADMNEDGVVDIFDIVVLRKTLLNIG